MDSETRRLKLIEIQNNRDNVVMTGIPLHYKGSVHRCNVYRIPLSLLIYNKYNGRIVMEVKSYERQYRTLDAERDVDRKIIEDFLYYSKEDRNEKTMESLLRLTQQKHGIVTDDGVIIDGNRRARLLNKLYHEREELGFTFQEVEHCQYFLAIILPEKGEEKDLQQLETIYQMGEDAKLDYNPIGKYLKCSDLKRVGFSNKDISEFMGEKESQIADRLAILELMEDFLDTYGYKGKTHTRFAGHS